LSVVGPRQVPTLCSRTNIDQSPSSPFPILCYYLYSFQVLRIRIRVLQRLARTAHALAPTLCRDPDTPLSRCLRHNRLASPHNVRGGNCICTRYPFVLCMTHCSFFTSTASTDLPLQQDYRRRHQLICLPFNLQNGGITRVPDVPASHAHPHAYSPPHQGVDGDPIRRAPQPFYNAPALKTWD